ncbi:clathrin interactor EPSIN 2-like [Hibiscus syriacus]|uniref:clathrin interactor EPSIN 2-like n=1 Tax=Hibiscus syriacus TaxID=106335 RepID=UPI0019231EB6|nr:clathrin interactor EPSIN 2-like [Hibiscus syriacus]
MKKALGQAVRDLKRGVNKKVLKVPGIEQKVLDATSNEPWGPHGSLLADIAMATRNLHEYQIIMAVIWKRINDTGKNWRHVYKGLTVLEYLVAHGSERMIEDIRERASQISSLSDFQYIDSSGRDQGSNIRKKSQSLVALVTNKERIIEVRQKAAANRDKLQNTPTGGMHGPGSGGQGDKYDYDYQYGYGKDREYGYRDDDRYGRYSDANSRDGDRYSRDYEDRNARDDYRYDEHRGKTRNVDGNQHGTRSRSSDRDRAFDDDGASSRGSSARADNYSQDGRQHEQKFSEQKNGAPPCYEEAVSESRSPVHVERDGETSVPAASRSSSPATNNSNEATSDFGISASPSNKNVEAFNELDSRVSDSAAPTPASTPGPAPPTAAPTASTSSEIDLLGDLSDSWAVVPTILETFAPELDTHAKSSAMPSFAAKQSTSNSGNQGFDDPFGDGPFKAFPSSDTASTQQQVLVFMTTMQPTMSQNAEATQPSVKSEIVTDFRFGESFSANAYSAPISSNGQPQVNSQFLPQELSVSYQENDILVDILPPSGPVNDAASHTALFAPPVATYGQLAQPAIYGQHAQSGDSMYQLSQPSTNPYSQPAQPSSDPYSQNEQSSTNPYGQPAQPDANPYSQPAQPNVNPYDLPAQPNAIPYGQPAQSNANPYSQPTQPSANIYDQPVQLSANPYAQPTQPSSNNGYGNFIPQSVSTVTQIPGSAGQGSNGSLMVGSNPPVSSQMAPRPQNPTVPAAQFNSGKFLSQQGSAMPVGSQSASQTTNGSGAHNNNDVVGGFLSQPGSNTSMAPQTAPPSSTGALARVPQPSKDKFEPKSAVWANTLSRGLVNLNISGPKTNPLADIGVDFDAINRKEKRLEKPVQTAVTSTITMGKAMGSGSGMGRAGASALRAPANPMMGSGVGMESGMGAGSVRGMDMGGYGGMNQQPTGMNPGMGMNNMGMNPGIGMNNMGLYPGMGMNNMGMNPGMRMNMMSSGMGMNMGMGQITHMQSQSGMPGSYNPMMGSGGYYQQPHGGGGYR